MIRTRKLFWKQLKRNCLFFDHFPCPLEVTLQSMLAFSIWVSKIYITMFTSFLVTTSYQMQLNLVAVLMQLLATGELAIIKSTAFQFSQIHVSVRLLG